MSECLDVKSSATGSVPATGAPSAAALTVELRSAFKKGSARKLRASGFIPAVLYGADSELLHLSIPAHQSTLLLRKPNALIELDVNGDKKLALAKSVSRNLLRQTIEHVDFILVKKGQKVEVDVTIRAVGDPEPGCTFKQEATTVRVLADALAIPNDLILQIQGRGGGFVAYPADLELPDGVEVVDNTNPIARITG